MTAYGTEFFSMRDVNRLRILQDVIDRNLRPGLAAEMLGITPRHCSRLLKRYRQSGPLGMNNQSRGRTGNRLLSASLTDQALNIIRKRYADFGPTLTWEKLAENHGLLMSSTYDRLQERLYLRPVISSDLNDLFKIYGDPATNTFNPAGPYPNIDHAKMVMNRWLDHWQTHSFGNWAISPLTNPEKIIGFGGLGIRNYDDIVINNLGYRLSTEAWGKGLATEFAIYAIKFGFDVIKLTEISAVVRENHLASQKVLQKSGLRYVKEIHDVKDAPPSLLYSISVDEWLRNLEVNASV